MKKNSTILLLLVSLLASCVERKTVITESQDYQFEKILPADLQNKVDTAKQKHWDSMGGKQNECDCDKHEHDANSVKNVPAKPILGKDPATYTPVKKKAKAKAKANKVKAVNNAVVAPAAAPAPAANNATPAAAPAPANNGATPAAAPAPANNGAAAAPAAENAM